MASRNFPGIPALMQRQYLRAPHFNNHFRVRSARTILVYFSSGQIENRADGIGLTHGAILTWQIIGVAVRIVSPGRNHAEFMEAIFAWDEKLIWKKPSPLSPLICARS